MIDYNQLDKKKAYQAFSHGDTWVSKLICFLTRSKFSHSFTLYWSEQYQSWLALGDNWNGCNFTPADTENTISVADVPVDLWVGLRKNIANLGSFYDYGAFVGMLWVLAGKWFFHAKKQWKNPFNWKGKFICSEICTQVIQDSGLDLGLIPSSTDPQTLYDALKNTPDVVFTE